MLPSTVAGSPTRQALPLGCAVLGAVTVVAYARRPGRPAGHLLLAGAAVAVAALLALHPARLTDAVDRVRTVRLSATSTDRNDEWRATLRLAGQRPIAGIGPGQFSLHYRSTAGPMVSDKYAHNEYLQLLAEEGAIGLILLAGGIIGVLLGLVGQVRRHRSGAVGALAALVALLVHSSFDFLWHIPAVVLLPVTLLALPLAILEW